MNDMKTLRQAIAESPMLTDLKSISEKAAKMRAHNIAKYGFPDDCECDLCGDGGVVPDKGHFCSCDVGRSMREHRERTDKWPDVCPDRFLDFRIETHPDTQASALVRKWVDSGFADRRNLILTGPVGTGKSGLALGAMYEIHMRGFSCKFDTFSMILDQLRPKDDGDKVAKRENLAGLIRVGLLVIDDLGTHKESEWTAEQLFDLINGRTSQRRPFIITTNWTTKEMAAALDDRLMSRLVESTDVVPVVGRDLRRRGRAA